MMFITVYTSQKKHSQLQQSFYYLYPNQIITIIFKYHIIQMTESIMRNNGNHINLTKNTNIKTGVFFNKDAKIVNLQKTNQQMRQLLQQQLTRHQQLTQLNQSYRSKIMHVQNSNKLLEIEQMMHQQSICKLENQINKILPDLIQKERQVALICQQVAQLKEQHQSLFLSQQQRKNLIQRYKQELKLQKMMSKSQKNYNVICESLRKNLQNYQKNINILKNKLQSKFKYLSILQKKKQKLQTQVQQKSQINLSKKQRIINNFSASKLENSRQKFNNKQVKYQQKIINNKLLMKDFNSLIRKKNSILAQKI